MHSIIPSNASPCSTPSLQGWRGCPIQLQL
jgi:hypothetical protein